MRRTIARTISLTALAGLLALGSCGKGGQDEAAPTEVPVAAAPATAPAGSAAPEAPVVDAAAIARGAALFQEKTCVACHGADAKTSLLPEYPKLAGQSVLYARQQMRDIKSGARSNGQTAAMKAVMTLVSDEQIGDLAAFLSSLPDVAADGAFDRTAAGAKLFRTKTCVSCHGKNARTPLLVEYPKIAGQNAAYALQQMRDIQSGARANGQTAAMKGVMHLVNDEELQTLAGWLSSLAP